MEESWRRRRGEDKIDIPVLRGVGWKEIPGGAGRGGHGRKGQRMGTEGTTGQGVGGFWSEEQEVRSAKRRESPEGGGQGWRQVVMGGAQNAAG